MKTISSAHPWMLIALALTLASPVRAQDPDGSSFESGARPLTERQVVSSSPRTLLGERGAFWLELGMTAGAPEGNEVVLFGGELGLRFRLAESLVADVSWGLSAGATHVAGETVVGGMPTFYEGAHDRVEVGNPTLGGAFVHRGEGLLLDVGLALAIPSATLEDAGEDANGASRRASSALIQRAAMAMRGYRGAMRWAPERFSLALPFRVVFAPMTPLFVEVDGALALLLPVLGDRSAQTDSIVEVGVGLGWNALGPLAVGMRLGGVSAPTGATLPSFTLSAEPWARLRFDPLQITARGLVLLTGQDGVGQSGGPSFGVLLGAGVEL